MPSRRTNNLPESGRGLGRVTPTIFGSTVGYPSDSLASCYVLLLEDTWPKCLVCISGKTAWIQHTCEQVGTHSTVVNNVNNRISVIKETNHVHTWYVLCMSVVYLFLNTNMHIMQMQGSFKVPVCIITCYMLSTFVHIQCWGFHFLETEVMYWNTVDVSAFPVNSNTHLLSHTNTFSHVFLQLS